MTKPEKGNRTDHRRQNKEAGTVKKLKRKLRANSVKGGQR